MRKLIVVLVSVIFLSGCAIHATNKITNKLQPTELYESYGVRTANLKARSKCPLPATINIVNMETRESDYDIRPDEMSVTIFVNPKELTAGIVKYLKYGFEKSQIIVDNNSAKILQISFKDSKLLRSFWMMGNKIQIKVDIPETKYSEIYEATDWAGDYAWTAVAYTIHVITRQIIDDPVIQDYILCR